jgi:hypothetical protein
VADLDDQSARRTEPLRLGLLLAGPFGVLGEDPYGTGHAAEAAVAVGVLREVLLVLAVVDEVTARTRVR